MFIRLLLTADDAPSSIAYKIHQGKVSSIAL